MRQWVLGTQVKINVLGCRALTVSTHWCSGFTPSSVSVQKLFLVVVRKPYRMLWIKPMWAACKANAFPTVLFLWPIFSSFFDWSQQWNPLGGVSDHCGLF